MLKKIIISTICIFLPMVSMADQLTLNNDAPKSYVVKKGDTLWDISGLFLKQPWLWPKLWRLNPEISNPHLIYPGDELKLVYDEQGQPMLVKGKPALTWSPAVRTQLKDQSPISTISLHTIAPFIQYENIFTQAELDVLPYVLGSDEGYKSSVDGFKVYVNGDLAVGKSYAIYQKGEMIVDPDTDEAIGYYAKLTGTAQAIRAGDIGNKKPSTLFVKSTIQEIRSGFIVVAVNDQQSLPTYYQMQAADASVRGRIIKSATGVREFGKLEVVMINRGENHQVKLGDVLSIGRQSPSVVESGNGPIYTVDAPRWNKLANATESDYDMPEEIIGKMMVFKVYPQVSMALILKTEKPVRLQDVITAPL